MADYTDLMLAAYNTMGQIGSAAMSYGTHKADRKFNAAQAQINRDWQEKMWNLANEYNHPRQQMQRLTEAGLNPALVYGDGATTLAARVGNVGNPSAPGDNIRYPDLSGAMLTALQMQQVKAQTAKTEADELLTRETAKQVQEQTEGLGIENMFKRDSYQLRLDQLEAENNLKASLANTEVSKRNEIQANINYLEKQFEYLDAEIGNKQRLTDQEIKESEQRIENSIKTTAATVVKLNADARKANAEAWLAAAEAAIKDNPEYQTAVIKKSVHECYKALQEGNISSIEYRLKALQEDLVAKPGQDGYGYKQFMVRWIEPATSAIGKVFSGGASYNISKKQ